MQITFRASPELLKVGEIGESIVKADDSFRRQFSILVLAAVRNREIPVRNKNGFKIPPESLDITERQTRDFAERHFLERLGDFDADLQRARESAAAQPWIQQHYNIDAKLQACANDFEKYKQHLEPQIQSETNRLLDDWYRDASVLVFEVAEWFCKAHDFEGQMTVSNSVGTGEIARRLAKWFDKPLDDLPPPLRKIAELYLPGWSELSDADRRARADEVDHQVQATLGDRFEKARMDVEQANAATPARFVQLAMQDGFDKVTREKAGERYFEAKVAAVNLSDERCIELAHSHELRIADWTALTGIGIGVHWSYVVSAEGVAFRKWTEGEISEASVDRQIEMHQDNEAAPLKFPCTPAMIILFIDAAQPGSHSFSVPDAFRQAVTDTPVPAEQPALSDNDQPGTKKPDDWIIRAREIADDIWLRELNVCKKPSKEGIAPEIARRLWDEKIVTKRNIRISPGHIVRVALGNGWTPPRPD
ncbi:MAG: hypothetical protein NFW16_19980 [Candidatus Accumulibacter sp.]|uniref:hypothetical protein n=1 Tax=Accumulibacter sp. TaxID=2053492 RepID=UPI002586CD71|nr:hypothetical protein [Accumulibacter sp.]MCM8623947.1 hypothetical protein [Accumulibacter sp.]